MENAKYSYIDGIYRSYKLDTTKIRVDVHFDGHNVQFKTGKFILLLFLFRWTLEQKARATDGSRRW